MSLLTICQQMSTDIKLSKTQISKIIHSGGTFGSWSDNLGKIVLTDLAIPLARDKLPGLVSNLPSNAINKFERKKSEKGEENDLLYLFWMKIWMILLKP